MRKAICLHRVAAAVCVASVCAYADGAAGQAMPGIDPVKVKTIPIHPTVQPNPPLGYSTMRTPSVTSPSVSIRKWSEIPTIKVQTVRISPTGDVVGPRDSGESIWLKRREP